VLSGRGLCDELITRPEESYRLCCVVVCDLETSRIGAPYIYDMSHLRVKFHVVMQNVERDFMHSIGYSSCFFFFFLIEYCLCAYHVVLTPCK